MFSVQNLKSYAILMTVAACDITQRIITLMPRWDKCHFADDIFKYIFLNKNILSSIKISLKFIPKGPINNISSLVQIMAWWRSGSKPLSEPMMNRSLMHICVTLPQWVKQGCWCTSCIKYDVKYMCIYIIISMCVFLYTISNCKPCTMTYNVLKM